jgi:hypothetical protein
MRALAGLLGGLGGLSGLLATSLATTFGDIGARSAALAAAACALGLLAAWSLRGGRDRLAGVLFLEALLGLAIPLGEYALIPGACFLSAAALAFARGRKR